jgi:hypothetical protein
LLGLDLREAIAGNQIGSLRPHPGGCSPPTDRRSYHPGFGATLSRRRTAEEVFEAAEDEAVTMTFHIELKEELLSNKWES